MYTDLKILLIFFLFNVANNAEPTINQTFFRSFSDSSHCTDMRLKNIRLKNLHQDVILTWHGAKVSECEFYVKTFLKPPPNLCFSIQNIDLNCDSKTSLQVTAKQNETYMLYNINCDVRPTRCIVFTTDRLWIKLVAPKEIQSSDKPLVKIRISFIHSLKNEVTVKKSDVNINTSKWEDTSHKGKPAGRCPIPRNDGVGSNVFMFAINGKCIRVECGPCSAAVATAIALKGTYKFKTEDEEVAGAQLDYDQIIGIGGGIITTVVVPVALVVVRRRMKSKSSDADVKEEGGTDESKRNSLLSDDSFQSI